MLFLERSFEKYDRVLKYYFQKAQKQKITQTKKTQLFKTEKATRSTYICL